MYSGDANNTGPVNSGCAAEPLVVNAPGVDIIKFTNGADANDPNGADVPNIIPGQPVTWTYQVTNTGTTHPAKADVIVTDNQPGVTPVFDHEQSGNGDQIFDPGEVWIYKATGTALDPHRATRSRDHATRRVHPQRHRGGAHGVHQPRYSNYPRCKPTTTRRATATRRRS